MQSLPGLSHAWATRPTDQEAPGRPLEPVLVNKQGDDDVLYPTLYGRGPQVSHAREIFFWRRLRWRGSIGINACRSVAVKIRIRGGAASLFHPVVLLGRG